MKFWELFTKRDRIPQNVDTNDVLISVEAMDYEFELRKQLGERIFNRTESWCGPGAVIKKLDIRTAFIEVAKEMIKELESE